MTYVRLGKRSSPSNTNDARFVWIRKLFIQHPFVGVQYTSEGNVKTAKNPRVAACLSGQLEVTDLHAVLAEHRSTLTGQSIETAQRRRADLKPDRRRSHQRGIYFIPHRPVCVTFARFVRNGHDVVDTIHKPANRIVAHGVTRTANGHPSTDASKWPPVFSSIRPNTVRYLC